MTFKTWKKAVQLDGWFVAADAYLKAVRIVHNAYVSRKMGQLSADGFARAIRWAYAVDETAARFEEHRNETRKLSTVV